MSFKETLNTKLVAIDNDRRIKQEADRIALEQAKARRLAEARESIPSEVAYIKEHVLNNAEKHRTYISYEDHELGYLVANEIKQELVTEGLMVTLEHGFQTASNDIDYPTPSYCFYSLNIEW